LINALMHLLFLDKMSSSLDKLVPVLNGTNWHKWEVCMTTYLQMQELWEVVSGDRKPIKPQPTVQTQTRPAMESTMATSHQVTMPPSTEDMAAYHAAMIPWKRENSKALGAITLRIAPYLRHHLSEKTAYLAASSSNLLSPSRP
jgi:hypothetical protein